MTTSVDRLIELIESIQKAAKSAKAQNKPALDAVLTESMDPVAKALGKDYQELSRDLFRLISQVRDELATSPDISHEMKERYSRPLNLVEKVFDARNFSQKTSQIFQKHFSATTIDSLHMLSDRMISLGGPSISFAELELSLQKMEEAVDLFCRQRSLDEKSRQLLKMHLEGLRRSLKNYEIFGENEFVERYSQVAAQFMAMFPDLDNADRREASNAFEMVFGRVRKHLGLSADIMTVGQTLLQALPKA